MGGYGSLGWGSMPWGGPLISVPPLVLVDVQAVRDNVFRLQFNVKVDFTYLGDTRDGSVIDHYRVATVDSTGLDGQPVRPVRAALAALSLATDVGESNVGRFVDLAVDRPMSCWPCKYIVEFFNLFAVGSTDAASGAAEAFAVYRGLQPQLPELMTPSTDIANPQTLESFSDPLPDTDPNVLGTYVIDDNGDYAFDEGLVSLKKRVLRRLIVRKGSFPHMPDYGVGVPDEVKRLNTPGVRGRIMSEAQKQISQEPEVVKCACMLVADDTIPSLIHLRVLVRTKQGSQARFDVPFSTE